MNTKTTPTTKNSKKQQPSTQITNQISHRFISNQHQPIFCEAVTQIAVGYPVSRLVFSNQPAQRSEDGTQITHYVAAELILPTNGLAELAKQLVKSLVDAQEQLGPIGVDWNQNLVDLISQLQSNAEVKK